MGYEKNKKQNQNSSKVSPTDALKELRTKIQNDATNVSKIPSIIEFVNDKKYLGLPFGSPPIKLFPLQTLILKCFYRGSPGNEDLELTPEDIELINRNNMNSVENGALIDKWNKGDRFRELVLVWGRRCLSENTEIVDIKTGRLWSLGELWDYGKTNLESWTYDEQTKSMTVMRDCQIVNNGKKEVFQIQTNSGHEIEATSNHPMLTEKGWVHVKDLKPKDKIALAAVQPFFGSSTELSEDDASVLGYLTSSCCDSTGSYIATTLKDGELLEDFKARLKATNADLKIETADNYDIKSVDERKYSYVAAQKATSSKTAANIVNLLQINGLKNKTGMQKFVPSRIFVSPKSIVSTYLKSIFSCDGELISTKSARYNAKIEASFNSLHLTKQIQHLLSRFGIFSAFQSKIVNGRPEHILTISKNSHVKRFVKEIGFISMTSLINEVLENVEDEGDVDSPIFAPIVQIRKTGTKRTFDLQVSDKPHLQNFVANGFICHNSGKDFLTSIIALYETMRLLETPGGNPYALYNLGTADPFTILTIANSSQQAKILFRQIKEKVYSSDYFKDKILPDGISSDAIYFLTPEDKKRNKELIAKGFTPNHGSIVVKAGHSNPDTLVGISCFVLLLDEIGLYKNTAGSSSGDSIFNSLAPTVQTYMREVPLLDEKGRIIINEDGKQAFERVCDGKIVCLSTPRGKEGIFYTLYDGHININHRLVCRAATWQVNPMQSKKVLMAAFPSMPQEKFDMEFGAEFSGTAGESFFAEELVEHCFSEKELQFRDVGIPGFVYFAHLDPASSSHNYALVVAHKEVKMNPELRRLDWRIVVDHIQYWSPTPGKPILIEEVDEYVVELNRRFHLGLVTYDHFNSQTSISKLRKVGIPTKMTAFTKQYKNIIYDHLYQLVIEKKLAIPNHLLLKNEMRNLQRKWLDTGFKVYPKKDGDVTTDDICDALAGACYNCMAKEQNKLPQGKVVNSPVSSGGTNNIVWRSMQGVPYGVGSGGQVARKLEQRASWPQYKM